MPKENNLFIFEYSQPNGGNHRGYASVDVVEILEQQPPAITNCSIVFPQEKFLKIPYSEFARWRNLLENYY